MSVRPGDSKALPSRRRREMPEIAEAQALLAALAETDEVKAEPLRASSSG